MGRRRRYAPRQHIDRAAGKRHVAPLRKLTQAGGQSVGKLQRRCLAELGRDLGAVAVRSLSERRVDPWLTGRKQDSGANDVRSEGIPGQEQEMLFVTSSATVKGKKCHGTFWIARLSSYKSRVLETYSPPVIVQYFQSRHLTIRSLLFITLARQNLTANVDPIGI